VAELQLSPHIVLSARALDRWVRGMAPLFSVRQFFSSPLISESDWASNLTELSGHDEHGELDEDQAPQPLVPFLGKEPKEAASDG
jgi:hypothetical protein